jgi:hypothetical protein
LHLLVTKMVTLQLTLIQEVVLTHTLNNQL